MASKTKRRRSTRLLRRDSLGIGDFDCLTIHEKGDGMPLAPSTALDSDCLTSGNLTVTDIDGNHDGPVSSGDCKMDTGHCIEQSDHLSCETRNGQSHTALLECETSRKRQLSKIKPIPDITVTVSDTMSSTKPSDDYLNFDDFHIQFEDDMGSPPKVHKPSNTQELTGAGETRNEKKSFKKPSAKRSRRRSSDTFILESNIITSPIEAMLDLPMGLPRARRSSRIRRKSIEIYKSQHNQSMLTVNTENEDEPQGELNTVKDRSEKFDAVDSMELLKIDSPVSEVLETEQTVPITTELTVDSSHDMETNATQETTDEEAPKKKARRGRSKKVKEPEELSEEHLEQFYKKQIFVAPDEKLWETIFESPMPGKTQKGISTKKYKRHIDFEDYQPQKYKLRRQKAVKRGWKAPSKKKREALDKLLQLRIQELENLESEDSSFISTESSRSSSLSEPTPSDSEKEVASSIVNMVECQSDSEPQLSGKGVCSESSEQMNTDVVNSENDMESNEHESVSRNAILFSEQESAAETQNFEQMSEHSLDEQVSPTAEGQSEQNMNSDHIAVFVEPYNEQSSDVDQKSDHQPETEQFFTPLKSQPVACEVNDSSHLHSPVEDTGMETCETSETFSSSANHKSEDVYEMSSSHLSEQSLNVSDVELEQSQELSPRHAVAVSEPQSSDHKSVVKGRAPSIQSGVEDTSVCNAVVEVSPEVDRIDSESKVDELDESVDSSNYESVQSNISDDSFQDFGNMTFDSSKEFPELLEDTSRNDSSLNTAIFINTPPDSRGSCCSLTSAENSVNQTVINVSKDSNTSGLKFDDSFITGSADMLGCM